MSFIGFPIAAALRQELSARALAFAKANPKLRYRQSYGEAAVVAFEPSAKADGHGNFHPSSYAAILADPEWSRRLNKRHSQGRSALPPNDRGFWCEVDSCNSSDALLMNVFCFPRVASSERVMSLLGLAEPDRPRFGLRARVPLANGNQDATEVDMTIGPLLVEAKLTESGFQAKPMRFLERYRDLHHVFDTGSLPRRGELVMGYQLVRNILAAHAREASFCALLDARRPDLLEQCWQVFRCVLPLALRTRCMVLQWQELAPALPRPLKAFLKEKYGI